MGAAGTIWPGNFDPGSHCFLHLPWSPTPTMAQLSLGSLQEKRQLGEARAGRSSVRGTEQDRGDPGVVNFLRQD